MVSLFTKLPRDVLVDRTTSKDYCFVMERLRYGEYIKFSLHICVKGYR